LPFAGSDFGSGTRAMLSSALDHLVLRREMTRMFTGVIAGLAEKAEAQMSKSRAAAA
jgi:hypothetical protein